MSAVHAAQETRNLLPEVTLERGATGNAIRAVADEYSRAQQAAAMAAASHRHPDRIRALYFQKMTG